MLETLPEIEAIRGNEIPEVKLLPQLLEVEDLISRTCEYFFKKSTVSNSPFQGFILEGPPGTGKTEVIKQVSKKLDRRIPPVYWLFVDGASIAAPRWGDAEKSLRYIFRYAGKLREKYKNPKVIIHFDDIECLMITRGVDIAKEWHYSINAILFHEIDRLDPACEILCATTNRPELVDEALKDRLFRIEVSPLPLDQLRVVIKEVLESSGAYSQELEESILNKLNGIPNPTIRGARQLTVLECIKNGVWSI
jgi:SpoVK/Ycf46/Vps4 family AAA+-type ATPase